MGWIDTLSKEAFQLAVREAMKPEVESLRASFKEEAGILRNDIKEVNKRVGDLEQRVSRLEGTIEGTIRAYEANMARMFAELAGRLYQAPRRQGQVSRITSAL